MATRYAGPCGCWVLSNLMIVSLSLNQQLTFTNGIQGKAGLQSMLQKTMGQVRQEALASEPARDHDSTTRRYSSLVFALTYVLRTIYIIVLN
ncbi:uncharacterized protein LOC121971775 isoform X2 [Zingiber officinale]|uniref:uncharacterized protein LOC121971775 isoform X2 n=1 Tax=Zingiber officinale TaxID=94328 RepID=UPI001C4C6E0B|nr:uncharacterized protein LOC121971775 isoform X2 [Zingiber officinale]